MALIGVLVAVFTISSEDVRVFNDTMVDATDSVVSSFEPLAQQMNEYVEYRQANVQLMETARVDVLKTIIE